MEIKIKEKIAKFIFAPQLNYSKDLGFNRSTKEGVVKLISFNFLTKSRV